MIPWYDPTPTPVTWVVLLEVLDGETVVADRLQCGWCSQTIEDRPRVAPRTFYRSEGFPEAPQLPPSESWPIHRVPCSHCQLISHLYVVPDLRGAP